MFHFIGGAKIYSARTIKVKDQEGIRLFLSIFKGILQKAMASVVKLLYEIIFCRTYYFYEFRFDRQHVALMATVDSGKVPACHILFTYLEEIKTNDIFFSFAFHHVCYVATFFSPCSCILDS